MGIMRIDVVKCNGCGICIDYCPMDVLRLDEKTQKAHIAYIRDCQNCFMCELSCPERAIQCKAVFERRIIPAW